MQCNKVGKVFRYRKVTKSSHLLAAVDYGWYHTWATASLDIISEPPKSTDVLTGLKDSHRNGSFRGLCFKTHIGSDHTVSHTRNSIINTLRMFSQCFMFLLKTSKEKVNHRRQIGKHKKKLCCNILTKVENQITRQVSWAILFLFPTLTWIVNWAIQSC